IKASDWLGVINRTHTRWMLQLAGLFLALMLVVVMLQVVFRFILGSSISWSEEVSKSLMVWSAFLVAPGAYLHGDHVSIESLQSGLSRRVQVVVRMLLHIIVLWLFVRLFWESLLFVERGWTILASSVPIEMAWVYLITPVSFASMLLVGTELVLNDFLSLTAVED
ncbi:MAG: TRAP transporter small permease subunit, partial [Myxococcota bacterium]